MNFELPPPIPTVPRLVRKNGCQGNSVDATPKHISPPIAPPLLPVSSAPEDARPPVVPSTPETESSGAAWAWWLGGIALLLLIGVLVGVSSQAPSPPTSFDTSRAPSPATSASKYNDDGEEIVASSAPPPTPIELESPLASTYTQPSEASPTPAPASPLVTPTPPTVSNAQAEILRRAALAPTQTYRVVGVSSGDYLNMRQGPSASSLIVHKVGNGVDGITVIGDPVSNGKTTWRQINCGGVIGWVSQDFLAQYGNPPMPTPNRNSLAGAEDSYLVAPPPVSTATVSWAQQSYTVDERSVALINSRISRAEDYVQRYVMLKGQQSDLQIKLSKSGPFGKKRLSDQLAATNFALQKTEREGNAFISSMLELIKKSEVH
ncbi:MAG: hypothetical protein PHC88_12115 [Terrimicrobiaceae bacterium]|nr:hypothetical protein [Terrimicrobiaceae bacterium]